MKINLPLYQISEFIAMSSYIDTNSIKDVMPILNFIKIEIEFGTCTLTKSNNISFCKYSFDINEDDISLLILEENLSLLVKSSKEEYCCINIDGDIGTITAGKWVQEINLTGGDIKIFPTIPETSTYSGTLTKEVIDCLSEAKVCLSKDKLTPVFTSSYVDNNTFYSANGHTIYTKTFNNSFPFISISSIECDMLSAFENVQYSIVENYKIYKHDSIIYGFAITVGTETGFKTQLEGIVSKIKKQSIIKIKVDEFISFCESTIKFSKSPFSTSNFFNKNNGFVELMFVDTEKRQKNILEISGTMIKGDSFDFSFQPNTFLNILRTLKYDYICIGDEEKSLSIFNDEDSSYLGVIQKVQNIS